MGTISAIIDAAIGEKERKGAQQNTRHRLIPLEGKAGLTTAVRAYQCAPTVKRLAAAYQAVKHDSSQEANYAP
jgi:hypothetical protein